MSHVKCVITGCALSVPQEGKAVWGELYETERAWTFNACLDMDEADWQYGGNIKFLEGSKALVVSEILFGQAYFERRGVIVLDKGWGTLNQAALDYLKR